MQLCQLDRRDAQAAAVLADGLQPGIVLEEDSPLRILENGRGRAMTPDDKARILRANDELSGRALRVLAVAGKRLEKEPHSYEAEVIEKDLTFCGLIAMIDPPRPEVKAAVDMCRSSGIRTVMITGDHKNTAVAIARELGFYGQGSRALSGEEIDRLSDDDLDRTVEDVAVYARVSPEHKLRSVRAWRRKGEVVAMTGDGVNDAPAVKEADIGVAMGITGTDVTKEVSDMVITDDNFASIVAAVEEGRGIYDNIKKYLMFLLSANLGEVLLMAVTILFGRLLGTDGALPLIAIQILWVNLATDGLPALALSVDPAAPDIMKRRPRPRHETVFTRRVVALMVLGGVWIFYLTGFLLCDALVVQFEGCTTSALFRPTVKLRLVLAFEDGGLSAFRAQLHALTIAVFLFPRIA